MLWMTIHILKLCVGATSIEDLRTWQMAWLAELSAAGRPRQMVHRTRMFPKRRDEVLAGGSLYWVIAGIVQVRQPILDLREVSCDDGITRCGIVYAPELIAVQPVPKRPFQGWRYLAPDDAPPDLDAKAARDQAAMPAPMRAKLTELGLL
jgi:hypothetical protein